MSAPRDPVPPDTFTRTVADAAAYERNRAASEPEDYEDYEDGIDEGGIDEDRCGCSDPCCPCGGSKRGAP